MGYEPKSLEEAVRRVEDHALLAYVRTLTDGYLTRGHVLKYKTRGDKSRDQEALRTALLILAELTDGTGDWTAAERRVVELGLARGVLEMPEGGGMIRSTLGLQLCLAYVQVKPS